MIAHGEVPVIAFRTEQESLILLRIDNMLHFTMKNTLGLAKTIYPTNEKWRIIWQPNSPHLRVFCARIDGLWGKHRIGTALNNRYQGKYEVFGFPKFSARRKT